MIDLNMCGQVKADGKRCLKKRATGDTMCSMHRNVVVRREQRRREDVVWNDVVDLFLLQRGNVTLADLNNIVTDAQDRGWITVEVSDRLRLEVREHLYHVLHPEQATQTTDLQRLAFDNQNVHTKEVSQQTTETQEFLLKTLVPKGQDTLVEVESAWYEKDTKKVMKDIRMYYKLLDNDHLYQRVLDGLWAHIQEHPHRSELIERLWEEATESVTKCYHGHMSRLSNVLVGFTEEVKADVPVGEILQQKIAVIAEKEIPTTHKVGEAWVVFEELHIPMVERDAWIEAL